MKKIILFELNEVPLNIYDYYISVRPNSWLAENYTRLNKYETYSENVGHLSPWNTWPTVHRGVSNEKHYIADFNEDLSELDEEFPPIWKILAENRVNVGVFGSLHTYPIPKSMENFVFYVPDVFSPNHECFPKEIEPFQKINLSLSRKSARNIDTSLPYADVLKAMLKIRYYGLTSITVGKVARQLVEEKVDPWKTVRRRSYQTVLSFDLFYKQLDSKKPDFTTFFTNHVASSLHRYWAALFPEDYEDLKYDDEWIKTYNNEILFTMDQTDRMLSKLGEFVINNPEYKLVVTSSMGQEAVECEPVETQLMLTDSKRFMKMFGLEESGDYTVMPAMVPQFNYQLKPSSSKTFEEMLDKTTINGSPISYRKKEGEFFSLDLGYANPRSIEIKVNNLPFPIENSGLEVVEIEDKSSATAYHIPQGHLFTFSADSRDSLLVNEIQLPTCDIVPLMLNNFGVKAKDYMSKTNIANF